mmetsp:Transcript_354/g.640  ORF Transcript_354/g.640 Transcript_354/m.640 type:complete len:183 (-) Transcript_354:2036-2584(-)
MQSVLSCGSVVLCLSTMSASESDETALNRDTRRTFSNSAKRACWNNAQPIPGRNPDRWRFDAVGNPVCFRLKSCDGCMCHEYDHIVPYSKGGLSTAENCQILQTRVNRSKGNDNALTQESMKQFSCDVVFSERELDLVEMAVYGSVQRADLNCKCKSIRERINSMYKLTTHNNNNNNNERIP